tara:strand:+ start:235 stop:678 length:444 start_codon:yes stop_codon:yes gene_type:complete
MKIIKIFFSFLLLFSCSNNNHDQINMDLIQSPLTAQKNADKVAMPEIEINKDSFDFGEIGQDESINAEFLLKNVGDAPLLIRSAKGSCGCTVPEWPREAIQAGEDAIVKVIFNSGKKKGKQNKTVTLVTNAIPSIKVLTIKGLVIVP